jgi:hypothetical protein
MDLQRDREPVGRGTGQARGGDELGEGLGSIGQRFEDLDRFVEDADTAYTSFHVTRLASQHLGDPRCQHPAL